MKVLVAGELNPDLIFSGLPSLPRLGHEILADDFSIRLGSSSAIFAVGLARLGAAVCFIGKAGDDLFGRFTIGEIERAGVDTGPVIVDARLKTGVTVSLSLEDRALVTSSGAMVELRAEDVSDELLGGCNHLHVSSYYLQAGLQRGLHHLFARARVLGLTTSLDPGCDPAGEWSPRVLDLLPQLDVFLLNEVELAALSSIDDVEEGLRRLSQRGALVIAKLGPQGCATMVEDRLITVPTIAVDALDTTGAGDSFNAGFMRAWLDRFPLRECLQCGVICGALSTRGLGGTASQPSWGEVEQRRREFQQLDEMMVTGGKL
jgi:sugar/nucleoside kinase (ribokinase family)